MPAHVTITKGITLKVHWLLPSVDGLLVGSRSHPRCPYLIALDGLSHDGGHASLPGVWPLPVKNGR